MLPQCTGHEAQAVKAIETGVRAQHQPDTFLSTIVIKLPIPTMSAADSDLCTLMDVPAGVLVSILRHVPFKYRLGVCTHVCRLFHGAAVAATHSISTPSMGTQAQYDQLSQWLQQHGGVITSLEAQVDRYCQTRQACQHKPTLASLPCPLLRDLDLYGLGLQPGFFSACTGLTRLSLESSDVEGSPHATSGAASNPLTQLSVLSSLQHLGLGALQLKGSVTSSGGTVLEFPSSLLSQLVQLTHLQLKSGLVQSDAALQHLSALSALQHLDLNLYCLGQHRLSAAALTGLQHLQHLTALHLWWTVPWAIDLHSMPAFSALTALRVLSCRTAPQLTLPCWQESVSCSNCM